MPYRPVDFRDPVREQMRANAQLAHLQQLMPQQPVAAPQPETVGSPGFSHQLVGMAGSMLPFLPQVMRAIPHPAAQIAASMAGGLLLPHLAQKVAPGMMNTIDRNPVASTVAAGLPIAAMMLRRGKGPVPVTPAATTPAEAAVKAITHVPVDYPTVANTAVSKSHMAPQVAMDALMGVTRPTPSVMPRGPSSPSPVSPVRMPDGTVVAPWGRPQQMAGSPSVSAPVPPSSAVAPQRTFKVGGVEVTADDFALRGYDASGKYVGESAVAPTTIQNAAAPLDLYSGGRGVAQALKLAGNHEWLARNHEWRNAAYHGSPRGSKYRLAAQQMFLTRKAQLAKKK